MIKSQFCQMIAKNLGKRGFCCFSLKYPIYTVLDTEYKQSKPIEKKIMSFKLFLQVRTLKIKH